MFKPWIESEVHLLNQVLLSMSSHSLSHLTTNNYEKNLFNQLPNIDLWLEEYHQFVRSLQRHNIQAYFIEDLLCETLNNLTARKWILTQVLPDNFDNSSREIVYDRLYHAPSATLSHALINGITYNAVGYIPTTAKHNMGNDFLLDPLVNSCFTRDPSLWLYDGVIICTMKHDVRRREALIMSCIYRYNQKFNHTIDCNIWFDGSQHHGDLNIEGGDVLIINKHTLMIGVGSRTNYQAIQTIAAILFERTELKHIIMLPLPKKKSFIHLDMALSMPNHHMFCVSSFFLKQIPFIGHISKHASSNKIITKQFPNLVPLLQTILNQDIQLIVLDNKEHERVEQKNCANNLLTINPGLVISYEHNYYTNELLDRNGIQVVTIPATQLMIGNGGVRCLSCPIMRSI